MLLGPLKVFSLDVYGRMETELCTDIEMLVRVGVLLACQSFLKCYIFLNLAFP